MNIGEKIYIRWSSMLSFSTSCSSIIFNRPPSLTLYHLLQEIEKNLVVAVVDEDFSICTTYYILYTVNKNQTCSIQSLACTEIPFMNREPHSLWTISRFHIFFSIITILHCITRSDAWKNWCSSCLLLMQTDTCPLSKALLNTLVWYNVFLFLN